MGKNRTFTVWLRRSGRYLKKNIPLFLSILSGAGVITTSYLSAKATPRALEKIREDSRINHDGDENAATKLEMVKSAWKCYLPAAITGATTIGCIFGSNAVSSKRIAGIASAYGLLDQYMKKYKEAAKTICGDDVDQKICAQLAKDAYVTADGVYVYARELEPNAEELLFYDMFSQRYFEATMAAVVNAQYHLNRNLSLRGDVTINEFYDFLGINRIDDGDEIGWSIGDLLDDEIMWLDFENSKVKLDDGLECCIISAIWPPHRFDYGGCE